MEPPWDVGNEKLFKCSWSHAHAHIWWKTSKIFFFGTKRPMTLKLGIEHQVLEYYKCFHMLTLGWPWPILWQGQICFRMLLHGWKLIQHWVLMYFQVCSNSAYPQHSGERHRPNGPLVSKLEGGTCREGLTCPKAVKVGTHDVVSWPTWRVKCKIS